MQHLWHHLLAHLDVPRKRWKFHRSTACYQMTIFSQGTLKCLKWILHIHRQCCKTAWVTLQIAKDWLSFFFVVSTELNEVSPINDKTYIHSIRSMIHRSIKSIFWTPGLLLLLLCHTTFFPFPHVMVFTWAPDSGSRGPQWLKEEALLRERTPYP